MIIAMIALFVGGFFWTGYSHREEVNQFVEEVLPLVGSEGYDDIRPYFAPEIQDLEPEKQVRIFEWFRDLGELKSFEDPQLVHVQRSINTPYPQTLSYRIVAYYSSGKAFVNLTLVQKESGEYMIWGLHITSDALLPKESEEEPREE